MFVAYLIDDPSYYQLKNRYQLYFLGILVPASILSTAFVPDSPVLHSLWLPLLLVYLAVRSFFRLRKTTKQIEALSKQTRIRLSETELSLENAAGEVLEKIPINEETRISALPEYQAIESNFRTIIQQFRGKPRPNYLRVEAAGKSHTFDLFLDSEYQIGQLKKLLSSWEQKGMLQYRES